MKQRNSLFILGMITAFLIQGIIASLDIEPLYNVNTPLWVYLIALVGVIVLTVMVAREEKGE